MDGFWVSGAVNAIRALSYFYDILTFPVYLILQRPWEKRQLSRRVKAKVVSKDERSITYRNIDRLGEIYTTLERLKIDTLEKVLRYAAEIHGDKMCLGTRQILAEENEVQPNGRVFKKVCKKKKYNLKIHQLIF